MTQELYLTHGEQPVREVMVPAEEIVALSTDVPVAENLRRMEERPLWMGARSTVVTPVARRG